MNTIAFPILMGKISERGITKKKIAEALGVSYRTFSNKMCGDSPIYWSECCIIQNTFFPDLDKDILFKTN